MVLRFSHVARKSDALHACYSTRHLPFSPALPLPSSYDAVEELVAEGEMAFNVAACLAKLPKDLDK